ncbi:MAG TPA: class I SAM-dependent methyltransferase [Polyangia bacterium]|jgi:SAM-dependent methyltransferase
MSDSTREFYEGLADEYRLLFADWNASVKRQGGVLEGLLTELGVPPGGAVLDCAAGVGTQSIGLTERGYRVTATDLSPASLEKLREEAARRGLTIPTRPADVRALDAAVPDTFDAVIAMDNALPHLSAEDLPSAVAQMRARLRPGGAFLISVRDYDALRAQRPRFDRQQVTDGPGGRRITFQIWDWAEDGSRYALELFVVRETAPGKYEALGHRAEYRAVGREELVGALRAAGLTDVRWRAPEESGFFQPVLSARAP